MQDSVPPARRPRIAITVGDPAGIGPEIALKCAAMSQVTDRCIPLLIGPSAVLHRVALLLNLPCPLSLSVADLAAAADKDEMVEDEQTHPQPPVGAALLDVGHVESSQLHAGQFSAATGQASFDAVEFAIKAAQAGQVDAIVTGPVQKEAWHEAGVDFHGHTELLAQRTGTEHVRMMLTSQTISCVLATVHMPLADVAAALSTDAILQSIRLGAEAVTHRLEGRPRVTVCGLNPHAGEGGLFSHGEEERIITPAIEAARQEGFEVIGPLPPDTAFTPHLRHQTDVYVCMYHDQGLIPLKALSFEDAVNVTLGLPIIRTSVDHGTAMNLAWQGIANHRSMLAAIDMAVDLCQ